MERQRDLGKCKTPRRDRERGIKESIERDKPSSVCCWQEKVHKRRIAERETTKQTMSVLSMIPELVTVPKADDGRSGIDEAKYEDDGDVS